MEQPKVSVLLADTPTLTVDLTTIASPVLRRIVEEIRNEQGTATTRAFDRVHVRHNR